MGGHRGERQKRRQQETQRTRTAQETLRKRHPVTSRGDAHHLRMRMTLRVGMHRCSQQVPFIYTHTFCVCVRVFVNVCVCVCVRVFV